MTNPFPLSCSTGACCGYNFLLTKKFTSKVSRYIYIQILNPPPPKKKRKKKKKKDETIKQYARI